MTIFEFLEYLGTNVWLYGGAFLLVLSLLVFIHEWGHYIVARLCGVGVEVFSIGFGKELFGFNDKNGTRWKFSLVPLGGYVKLFGDVDPASAAHDDTIKDSVTGQVRTMTPEERETAFFAKPVWKRAAVVFAGPAINYIFAVIVLAVLFSIHGQPVTPPSAAAIMGGSSADKYGFQPHDLVLSIDGKEMDSFEDIRQEMMISLDYERHFVVERNGNIVDIYAQPEKVEQEDRFGFRHSRGLLGLISPSHAIDVSNILAIEGVSYAENDLGQLIADLRGRLDTSFTIEVKAGKKTDTLMVRPLSDMNEELGYSGDNQSLDEPVLLYIAEKKGKTFVQYAPGASVVRAMEQTWDITVGTLRAMGQMIIGTRSPSELGGVIRIGALAGDMAQRGFVALVLFTALLSINLGLINLFPIPLLDGGHLLFYAFEAVLGRPVSDRVQEYAFRAGLLVLVTIMVFTNLNDLVQLIL